MQFNPISHQLLSCAITDIAFWSAEQKAVQKMKSGGRVNCCAWTKDGQYLAIGLAIGYVSIRNKVRSINDDHSLEKKLIESLDFSER